jgi:hypothetical protein
MGWLSGLGRLFGKQEISAASQLPPVVTPTKLKNAQVSAPSYLTTAKPSKDSALPRTDRRLATTDLETYRNGPDSRAVIRSFASASPDLSASVNAYIRTAITPSYTAVAKNPDGTFNREATSLLQQLLVRFDNLQNYDDGFAGVNTLRGVAESLAKEIEYYGACSLELVLDKTRLPRTLQPISVTQIRFYPDKSGKWLAPKQVLSGTEIDLDIATFFYTALDQDLLDPYASSPLEPSLQSVMFSTEFMNDLRRIVKRSVHPRLIVSIDEEKFRKYIPSEYQKDAKTLADYLTSVIDDIQAKVDGLAADEALVFFDTIGVDLLNNGNASLEAEYKTLSGIIDAKMATGAKTLPSVLGHGSGSQNIASSETLMFMRNAQGGVQSKINEILSRALTLAVRLFGQDVYVEFKFDEIDLRPSGELEAFKVMKQSRVLEQLSYGFITDDEAGMLLTGQLPPPGMPKLSGTMFLKPMTAEPGGNPNSNTSNGNKGPQDQKSKTPEQPKGPVRVVK